jgi:hypothetical protein
MSGDMHPHLQSGTDVAPITGSWCGCCTQCSADRFTQTWYQAGNFAGRVARSAPATGHVSWTTCAKDVLGPAGLIASAQPRRHDGPSAR